MIAGAIATGCLLVAAAAGRISGLGPLLAGLVLGAGPGAWIVLDHASYVDRANDIPEIWNHTSFGLVGAAVVLYPSVAGLLLGAAVAGKWRRPAPAGQVHDLTQLGLTPTCETARFAAMTRRVRTVLSLVAALGLAAAGSVGSIAAGADAARHR